jgi:serine/threonine protein kinase/Tfp pilus assembly protein PilF
MNEDLTLPLSDDPTGMQNSSAPRPAPQPLQRDTWGGFKLLARVGYGSFGEVYRAWDPNLEREIALKLLLPGTAGEAHSAPPSDKEHDKEYKATLREARALASVQHTNIVRVYGIDRHDGRVGFWTDFIHGKTLSVLIGAQGPFGYREAALIALDVARALSAVHRAGILHRDIKAENVMREDGGRILLMDFGLSTLPQRQTNIAGTPNYMAPELFRGEPASIASDIYAMGALLYFLVTGTHSALLGGLTPEQATAAIARRTPLMDLRSDLPESFLRTVSTAMDLDPAKRYASAGQLSQALAECLGTAVPIDASGSVSAPQPKPNRTRLWAGLSFAAVVLIAATFAIGPGRIRHWLNPEATSVPLGASTSVYDEYDKAEALLQKSYKDANVAEAITIFNKIPKQDPTFALAQAGLGSAYFAQYRNNKADAKLLAKAKSATALALQMDHNLALAYVTSSQIEAEAGNADVAFDQAQKATKLQPRSADAHGALAEVYISQGRTEDAIAEVQKSIDIAPLDSRWPVRLGNYLFAAGRFKDSAKQLEHAVELDPQNTTALYDLGIACMHMNQLEEARTNFEKVLAFGPDADSYKALGQVFMMEGKYPRAIETEKKAISLNSQDPQNWANLGSAYLWSGDRERSLDSYRNAIRFAEAERATTPNDPVLLIDLANDYASVGDAANSLRLISQALALSSEDMRVAYFAGESYELLGQRSKAIPLISQALAEGYQSNLFERSPELASLRADPVFQVALVTAKERAKQHTTVDSAKKLN